jgi:hypothetical protein
VQKFTEGFSNKKNYKTNVKSLKSYSTLESEVGLRLNNCFLEILYREVRIENRK